MPRWLALFIVCAVTNFLITRSMQVGAIVGGVTAGFDYMFMR